MQIGMGLGIRASYPIDPQRAALVTNAPTLADPTIWLYRYFNSTTSASANEYFLGVPFAAGRYALYGFRGLGGSGGFASTPSVVNFGRILEAVVGLNTVHGSCTKVGTWTTTTEARTYGGNYARSATAGDTIARTVTGHTLVVRNPRLTNGGYALVSIDGSATAATSLPAVTQADIDGGAFVAGDLGKRYLNCYSVANIHDEHNVLAEGLADTTHDVLITVKGTKPAASSDVRVTVAAICGASAGTAPNAANASFLHVRQIFDHFGSYSSVGSVVRYAPQGQASEWMSESHGNEVHVSDGFFHADGTPITLAEGEYASNATEIYLDRVTDLRHSATGATNHARKTMRFSARADRAMQLLATWDYDWGTTGTIETSYAGMMPISRLSRVTASTYNTVFEGVRFGTLDVEATGQAASRYGQVRADYAAAYSSAHDTVAVMYQPRVDLSLNAWQESDPDNTFLEINADGSHKLYFTRCASGNTEAITAASAQQGYAGWRVLRVSGAAALLGA